MSMKTPFILLAALFVSLSPAYSDYFMDAVQSTINHYNQISQQENAFRQQLSGIMAGTAVQSDVNHYNQIGQQEEAFRRQLGEIMSEKDPEKLRQRAAVAEHMARSCEAQTSSLRFRAQQEASINKFRANQEYTRQTGKSFDPSRRPVYRGREQDAWDACKRIHDIYNN